MIDKGSLRFMHSCDFFLRAWLQKTIFLGRYPLRKGRLPGEQLLWSNQILLIKKKKNPNTLKCFPFWPQILGGFYFHLLLLYGFDIIKAKYHRCWEEFFFPKKSGMRFTRCLNHPLWIVIYIFYNCSGNIDLPQEF